MYRFPTDLDQVREDFGNTFRLPFGDYYDGLISIITFRFVIDIVALNRALERRHPQYAVEEISIMDFVRREYGPEAAKLLDELTLGAIDEAAEPLRDNTSSDPKSWVE